LSSTGEGAFPLTNGSVSARRSKEVLFNLCRPLSAVATVLGGNAFRPTMMFTSPGIAQWSPGCRVSGKAGQRRSKPYSSRSKPVSEAGQRRSNPVKAGKTRSAKPVKSSTPVKAGQRLITVKTVTSERFSRAILGHGFGQHLTHLQIIHKTRAGCHRRDAATAPRLSAKHAFPRKQIRSDRRSRHYYSLTHYAQTAHNGAMAAPTEHQVVLDFIRQKDRSQNQQGTIATMPRQRSALLPEAHASSTLPLPTATPDACVLRAHPRSARFLVDGLLL